MQMWLYNQRSEQGEEAQIYSHANDTHCFKLQ